MGNAYTSCGTHTMEYYATISKDGILQFAVI